jgi:uncharacterized protein (UPF0261 family)
MQAIHRITKVDIDHLDAPVFNRHTIAEFRDMLDMFASINVIAERFPVRTRAHGGLGAALFNNAFVGGFNLLPRSLVRRTGHHLVAFAMKQPSASASMPAPGVTSTSELSGVGAR